MNDENIFYVYVDYTLEQPPRAFYVGKGKLSRVQDHKESRRNAVHNRISKKYGLERKIIFETKDEEEAFKVEVEKIAEYKTFIYAEHYSWGVNLTPGGEGVVGCRHNEDSKRKISEGLKGHKAWNKGIKNCFSEESRLKISEKNKNKRRSEETKQKIRDFHLGKKMSEESKKKMRDAKVGTKLSDDHKKKIGQAGKGKKRSEETKKKMSLAAKSRPVEQLSLDGIVLNIFNSIKEATLATGASNIGACCRGIRNTSGGFRWKFKDLEDSTL
jgi:hypothetical protein